MSGQQQLDANTAVDTVNVASGAFFLIPALSHRDLFGLCKAEWEIKLQFYRSVLSTYS